MVHVLLAAVLGGVAVETGSGAASGSMLIVAPRALAEASQRYADQRSADVRASVVVLEEVLGSSTGCDDAEKLKRYLYERWKQGEGTADRLRYVLLVGDADVLPVRYMCLDRWCPEAFNYAFYPSDLYYGDVAKADGSFESWNGSTAGFHSGYFGEVRGETNKADPINLDAVDYRPELAVGRWPASTPEQVAAIASKSIAYIGAQSSRGASPRAGLIAVGGWIENRPAMDAMGAALGEGWELQRRYFKDGADAAAGGDAAAAPAPGHDEASVVALFNEGVDIVLHSGHGFDDGWDQSITAGSLGQFTNSSRPAVVMSAGCSTARFATLPPYEAYIDCWGHEQAGSNNGQKFTEPPPPPACYQTGRYNLTGLGERMLRDIPGGAVAYIGCNTGSQPCGMTLITAMAERIGKRHGRLGDCWAGAMSDYYDRERLGELKPDDGWYPPSIFFQGMKFMLFGDPSLPVAAP
ncbi:MAG: C25 family cysteine peptidase [Phycisphaerales bacterium]|nr:C25 family cysteine peptidase [Phycisphaerales bacterium]